MASQQSQHVALPTSSKGIMSNIAPFVANLHHILSNVDPELIHWSEDGNSIVVSDRVRLEKEVLGYYWRTDKYESFKRQLSKYGFDKVRQVGSGAMRSKDIPDVFQHEAGLFQRGREDLLPLIKQRTSVAKAPKTIVTSSTPPVASAASTSGSAEISSTISLLEPVPADVPAIPPIPGSISIPDLLQIIAAVQSKQKDISTQMLELKRSNEALWQEAMQGRVRQQKMQDTLNLILTFIAGLLGKTSPVQKVGGPIHASLGQGSRLMIEDGGSGGNIGMEEEMQVEEVDGGGEDNEHEDYEDYVDHAYVGDPSPPPTDISSVNLSTSNAVAFPSTPQPGHASFQPTPTVSNTIPTPVQPIYSAGTSDPHIPPDSPNGQFQAEMQTAFGQMSEAELQMLYDALNSASAWDPEQNHSEAQGGGHAAPASDFGTLVSPTPTTSTSVSSPSPAPVRGGDGLGSSDASSSRLASNWEATEDIENDVSSMNNGINTLAQALGLDANHLESFQSYPQSGDHSFTDMFGHSAPNHGQLPYPEPTAVVHDAYNAGFPAGDPHFSLEGVPSSVNPLKRKDAGVPDLGAQHQQQDKRSRVG